MLKSNALRRNSNNHEQRYLPVFLEKMTRFQNLTQVATDQSAFFDFCAGNRHQIVAGARV